MKAKELWDYSHCQIGHPCELCTDTCSFKKDMEEEKNGEKALKAEEEDRGTVACIN